jgi:predicted GNAT family acetyltransferase
MPFNVLPPYAVTVSIVDTGRRFELRAEGGVARLVYRLEPHRLVLEHTIVPDALSGRGIGAQLVQAGLERARRDGLTVVPECDFARAWLRRHPASLADLAVEWPAE